MSELSNANSWQYENEHRAQPALHVIGADKKCIIMLLKSKTRLLSVYLMILLAFVLVSCVQPEKKRHTVRSLTDEEEEVVYAAVSQLPHESPIRPYVIASDLAIPRCMFDPSYDAFQHILRQSAKDRSQPILSAVEDFLDENQPTHSASMESSSHRDVLWVKADELNSLLASKSKGSGMKWFQFQEKYGNTPRFFRVSRPGIDQSNTTAIIYIGVHYPAGPSYGGLHILSRKSNRWIAEHDKKIGPAWAF